MPLVHAKPGPAGSVSLWASMNGPFTRGMVMRLSVVTVGYFALHEADLLGRFLGCSRQTNVFRVDRTALERRQRAAKCVAGLSFKSSSKE